MTSILSAILVVILIFLVIKLTSKIIMLALCGLIVAVVLCTYTGLFTFIG